MFAALLDIQYVHVQSVLRVYSVQCVHVHDYEDLRPAICVARTWCVIPTLPVTPAQLMRPGIDRNASCASGDCLTSRPEGRSRPRELWFSIYSCVVGSTSIVHAYLT